MKKFEEVTLELITFVKDDVITTSGQTFSSLSTYSEEGSWGTITNGGLNFD